MACVLGKLEEDFSTYLEYDPELWLEAGATSGCDKNQIYDFFMIMTEYMRLDCCISTIDTSLSYTRHQSLALKV